MKPIKLYLILAFTIAYCQLSIVNCSAQNIGVNTTGNSPAVTNLFEVLQPSTTANTVGIHVTHSGAISGTGYALEAIKNGASVTNIAAYLSASGATNNYALIIPSTGGNVGIGTTTPQALLDIVGSTESIYCMRANGSNSNAPNLRLRKARGTSSSPTNVANGDYTGHLTFEAYDGSTYMEPTGIWGHVNGTVSAGSIPIDLVFSTGVNGNVNSLTNEKMRITSTGNVGVGTTSPGGQLDVISGNRKVRINGIIAGISTGGLIEFSRPDDGALFGTIGGSEGPSDDGVIYWGGGGTEVRLISGGGAGNGFSFYTGGAGGMSNATAFGNSRPTSNLVMKITDAGNVGIGTATPNAALEVAKTSPMIRLSQQTAGISTLSFFDAQVGSTRWEINNDGTDANKLKFWGYGAITPLTMDTLGNVGIGTTVPSEKLDITGNIRLNSTGNSIYAKDNFAIYDIDDANRIRYLFSTGTYYDTRTGGAHRFNIAGTEKVRIDQNGNVGIGTTAPATKLEIAGGVNGSSQAAFTGGGSRLFLVPQAGYYTIGTSTIGDGLAFLSGNGAEAVRIDGAGNVGIGTTAPVSKLEVNGNVIVGAISVAPVSGSQLYVGDKELTTDAGIGTPHKSVQVTASNASEIAQVNVGVNDGTRNSRAGFFLQDQNAWGLTQSHSAGGLLPFVVQHSTTERLRIDINGNIGIGTNNPLAQLHTTSTVRFATFGAGTMQTDASGNVSVSSDVRLKHITGDFTKGLDAIMGLTPKTYKWNKLSGLDEREEYSGFIAQNVQQFIPEAVNIDNRGFLTLSDRPIIAALVNAIKNLSAISEEQQQQIEMLKSENKEIKTENTNLKQKTTEIDSLKNQNETLKSEIKSIKTYLGIEAKQ